MQEKGVLVEGFWWLAIAALAAIVEAVSSSLVTVWFIVGALAAFGTAFAGGPLWLQLVVFAVVSVACLVLIRPLAVKNRVRGKEFESTPIGQQARVVETIDSERMAGRVQTADRMTWAALSRTGEPIEEGASVRVVDQQSVKLVVEKL